MSIRPMPKGAERNPKAICTCDLCGFEDRQTVDYERKANGGWKMNEGQVLNRLMGKGWSHVKGVLRCPDCEAKRKEEKPVTKQKTAPLTVVQTETQPSPSETPPRQPTREQKRQIVALLTDVYDVDAGRYKGAETDKTVADTIGGGVMLGWVAQIREEMFGPDGANDELVQLERQMAAARADVDHLTHEVGACLSYLQGLLQSRDDFWHHIKIAKNKYDEITDRLESHKQAVENVDKRLTEMKAAVGPRADRV